MNFFSNLKYFSREAMLSIVRNRILTIATITTIAICIFIVGLALLITLNANNFIDRLESDLEIVVFLDNSLLDSQMQDIQNQIEQMSGIQSIAFVSKDESLAKLQSNLNTNDLNSLIGENPLPNTFKIKAVDAHQVQDLAIAMSNIAGIYKINYGQGFVEKLFQVTVWVKNLSIALIIVLAFGAVFLVATSIRLAIFSRRKEIYLMRLIGATNWFIRWPFFLEGISMGTVGSLFAVLFLNICYRSIVKNIPDVTLFTLVQNSAVLVPLFVSLLIIGIILGVVGTFVSLNRFLKA
ncbi:MAG: permease-like cell division protein FtsX [Syntrophomonadaceae bacterium]|jgi:cell division transport system permease protein|nr:permease-like cell division protein FtsX [Syntrophomonadaceae bacterium]